MKDTTILSDCELVLEYQSGNRAALSGLVKKWHIPFCKLAYWYVKDADVAKDIVQESWVIIFKKLDTLKNPKQFKSWSISIVNRKAIDWIRANKRESNKLNTFYNEKDKSNTIDESEEQKTKLISILKIEMDVLPTNQKMIIKLFYTENYSLQQISEALKISVGTAKSRLFHAREKLKKSLKHKYHEE
ncbi:RNA polymerase sigma factor SigV [Polaribacter huanghezhanensis]|uniref:RNA polymerase sigma factor n=1 Tax=Polaribacter huanghezhanensis TaxID=1354726 RepID=UPI0026478E1C|nr:RNA polymerase sigma factor [Polaribacter huanghezhanensis]WKD86436.1 RNA polymerase sigma factor SigV [Polaribacter huanghezhanensis]